MQSKASSPDQYMAELPADRKKPMTKLRETILENLPEGFEERVAYGMIGYVVPHRIYPPGYHCDPKLPLALLSIASQKNFIAIYHMGIYADPNLLSWFTSEYAAAVPTKLDMGKSCIRFKNPAHIPYELIGRLAAKLTPQTWVALYENALRSTGRS